MANLASHPAAARWPPLPWRGWLALAAKAWPAVLASLAILALLAAFDQVVRGAVIQGDLRRQAVALHAEATWRCKALRDISVRQTCLAELNSAPALAP